MLNKSKYRETNRGMRTEAESGKVRIDKERFFNLPVVILIASSFMLGMSEFIVVGILPDIAADLKISEVTVGNLVSLFAFVYAPVTPLGSALSARFPRFATHLTLIGIFLAGNILCAFAPNYAVLVVARIMIALVSGTLVAVAMTYAPDVTTDKFRTKFIAWVFSGFSIASVVGVPVGTWVANTFGWRWAFHIINVLTIMLIVGMVVALPRNSHIVKIGFLPQFRLFFDRRIQLGVLTVVFGAACLWSNLYGGKLADRGRGVEPLTYIRPIYCAHAVLMASLVVAHWVPVYGALLLVVLGMFMYLQNSASQVLYMDVASQSHPGSLNLAASLNSMSFNIGIALGSAVGGLVNGHFGLTWLGPVGALFLLCAIATTTMLRPFVAQERKFYATQRA